MIWSAPEKAMVARILRDMLKESATSLVTGVLHPGNGHPDATPTDAVRSWIRMYAARYALEIEKPAAPIEEEPPRLVPRRRPALKRKERKTR